MWCGLFCNNLRLNREWVFKQSVRFKALDCKQNNSKRLSGDIINKQNFKLKKLFKKRIEILNSY